MTTENQLANVEETTGLIPDTDVQQRVRTMLANRKFIIEQVRPLLKESVDIYVLPGMKKPSLGKPGAEKLAAIFGMTAKFEVDKETIDMIGPTANGKPYVAFVCNLSAKGRVAGQGRGATMIEYMRNAYENIFQSDYDRLSEEEKEKCQGPIYGTSKKGQPYTMYRKPAPPVNDPLALNKAIKMAQKSAFVDAVIRATGMSDLFTQDVEDGVNDAPQNDEPFEGTPNYTKPAAPASDEPAIKCNACQDGHMKKRQGTRGLFYGCSNYSNGCRSTMTIEEAQAQLDGAGTFGQHLDEIKK